MKRLMMGATIIALLASPVASAEPGRGRDHRGDYEHSDRQGGGEHRGGQWRNGRWQDHNGRAESRRRGWHQDRGNHYGWSRGQRMGYNDWRYAQRVDYRRYNLRQPPRGYEWRRNDDRFLMVAIATGLIASVIISNDR